MSSSRALRSVLLVGGGSLVAAAVPAAQHAIRDPFATRADVVSSRISPDSASVVYLADAAVDGAFELYEVPITGGTVRKLNASPVAGGDVMDYAISPDSASAVFRGDLDADETFELYACSMTSGAPVRLSQTLVAGGDVIDFAISPDAQRVVFRADAETDGLVELYSVALAGGSVAKLNGPLGVALGVAEFRISPDGGHVVYRADTQAFYYYELWSVPIGGGPSVQLSDSSEPVYWFQLSSGKHVVYEAFNQLYSVPITGGSSIDITPEHFASPSFRIHPDGARVIYLGEPFSGIPQLFSVPIEGGPATTVNGPLVDEKVDGFELSPDGAWAVYHLESGDADRGLYSASLEKPLIVDLATSWNEGRITADSSHVVFENYGGMWSTPIDGGPVVPLVYSYLQTLPSPDSTRLVYRSCHLFPNFFLLSELFSVPIDGGAPVRLNAPLAPGGIVTDMEISPDSARVVYRADQDQDNVFELFSVPLAGGTPVQLNPRFR